MNQQALEQALGKLIRDGGFRDAFFRNPATATPPTATMAGSTSSVGRPAERARTAFKSLR
jgi:hypothetical protein